MKLLYVNQTKETTKCYKNYAWWNKEQREAIKNYKTKPAQSIYIKKKNNRAIARFTKKDQN